MNDNQRKAMFARNTVSGKKFRYDDTMKHGKWNVPYFSTARIGSPSFLVPSKVDFETLKKLNPTVPESKVFAFVKKSHADWLRVLQ